LPDSVTRKTARFEVRKKGASPPAPSVAGCRKIHLAHVWRNNNFRGAFVGNHLDRYHTLQRLKAEVLHSTCSDGLLISLLMIFLEQFTRN
jgi:hypothetical protein